MRMPAIVTAPVTPPRLGALIDYITIEEILQLKINQSLPEGYTDLEIITGANQ